MHAPTTTTTTTSPTEAVSVPLPPERLRARRYWAALSVAVAVAGLAGSASVLIETPYATLAPGSARALDDLVRVSDVDTYPTSGSILFLTVGVDDDVSLLEAAAGWVDPDIDVLPIESIIPPDVSEEENRERNAQAMVGSKQAATVVALQRLGYELDPTGTGAVVTALVDGTPASERLQVTDTIVAVDGTPVRMWEDLAPTVSARRPGETVTLDVESQEGETRQVEITLAAREDDPDAGFLGVGGDTRDFDPGLPFPIDIDSGDVGGPSAGLAFTLALLDLLSEGDLTGGRTIAVTGTIDLDGTVGRIGGIEQKAAAAADAGAEVFLVPADEVDEARRYDHGLEIVPVADLDDALAALEAIGGDPLPNAS